MPVFQGPFDGSPPKPPRRIITNTSRARRPLNFLSEPPPPPTRRTDPRGHQFIEAPTEDGTLIISFSEADHCPCNGRHHLRPGAYYKGQGGGGFYGSPDYDSRYCLGCQAKLNHPPSLQQQLYSSQQRPLQMFVPKEAKGAKNIVTKSWATLAGAKTAHSFASKSRLATTLSYIVDVSVLIAVVAYAFNVWNDWPNS